MALIGVWLAVAVGTAMGRGALTRYAIELAPITWILGSAGVAYLIAAIQVAHRNLGGGPPQPRTAEDTI